MTPNFCGTVCGARSICLWPTLRAQRRKNSYTPAQPYVLNVLPDPRPQDMEPGYLRLFLQTAGADSPRPIKLRQKPSTGEWFLWEYSSPLSGIRIPAAQDPWA